MEWHQLDFPTKAALIATAMAIVSILVPPISMTIAVLAIVFSATAINRARRGGVRNRLALTCLAGSAGLILIVVVGSAIYSAGN